MKNERGFTLIELLAVMALTAILLTLSAGAIRHYWFVRSLEGGADAVVTQLRELQASVGSESNPIVFGGHFEPGTERWTVVRYDPRASTAAARCSVLARYTFDSGVQIESVAFTDDAPIRSDCTLDVAGADPGEFVFFYSRGSGTGGSVTLAHPRLGGRERTIDVRPITGRVTKS